MSQLNLFTDKVCDYCGRGEPKPTNFIIWNGFLDQDTGQLVCNGCKVIHYIKKAEKMGTLERHPDDPKLYRFTGMTYSEMPVKSKEI